MANNNFEVKNKTKLIDDSGGHTMNRSLHQYTTASNRGSQESKDSGQNKYDKQNSKDDFSTKTA